MNKRPLYTLLLGLTLWLTPASAQGKPAISPRLAVLERYVEHFIAHASDSHSGRNSPLLAGGIRIADGTPMLWHNPDGTSNILSNFSAQQNFMRVLAGLSALTGNPRYRDIAVANIEYYFAHYQDSSGLLYWGGHRFIDLKTLRPVTVGTNDHTHELKNGYPFYDLMYEVNPEATTKLINGIWNAHVLNWEEIETSRHGNFGIRPNPRMWQARRVQLPAWREVPGLSFLNAGNDLIYAASVMARHTGNADALAWAEHLAYQYVYPRDPVTGLGVYQFTKPQQRATTTDDRETRSWFGDRALRQFGPEFGPNALEGNMLLATRTPTIYSENALMQLQLAQELGAGRGDNFKEWTVAGLSAFAKHAYDATTGMFRPMIADGQDLSGWVLPRDGYYGRAGTVLNQYRANAMWLLSFTRAYAIQSNADLWTVIEGISRREDLGSVGTPAGAGRSLNRASRSRDPYAIFALIDLYTITGDRNFLTVAERIADNIIANNMVRGFFVGHHEHIFANIDSIMPYAILSLEAALLGRQDQVAPFINGAGFTEGVLLLPDGQTRRAATDQQLLNLRRGQTLSPRS